MKKTLSIILSICMLLSVTAGLNLTAQAYDTYDGEVTGISFEFNEGGYTDYFVESYDNWETGRFKTEERVKYCCGNTLYVTYDDEEKIAYYSDVDEDENYCFISDKGYCIYPDELEVMDDQDENYWDDGEHEITISYCDAYCYPSVYVVENPVKSIDVSFSTTNIVEYDPDYYYEDEDGSYYDFYNLLLQDGTVITVSFTDGRVIEFYPNSVFDEEKETEFYEFIDEDDNNLYSYTYGHDIFCYSEPDQSEEPLYAGDEVCLTLELLDATYNETVSIVKEGEEEEEPGSDSDIRTIQFILDEDNYMDFFIKDFEESSNNWSGYFDVESRIKAHENNSLIISYEDGSTVEYVSQLNESEDEDAVVFVNTKNSKDIIYPNELSVIDDQSEDNIWEAGKHNATVFYNDFNCKVVFTVVNYPIKSMTFTPVSSTITQGDANYGETKNGTFLYAPDNFCYQKGNKLTVEFKDKSVGTVVFYGNYTNSNHDIDFRDIDGCSITKYLYGYRPIVSVDEEWLGKSIKVGDRITMTATLLNETAHSGVTIVAKKSTPSKSTTNKAATVKAPTAPAATKISKAKAGKKKVTVNWKAVSGASGYEIQYSLKKNMKKAKKKTVKSGSKTKLTIKKLKSKKKYYIRIRSYKVVNGKKLYSKWSKVKKVKVK